VGCGIERLSHEKPKLAEAETLIIVEGNMCGTDKKKARCRRSAGVEGHITLERNALEPERSQARPQAAKPTGPRREGEEPKPMMNGHEKSDFAVVAMKPPNKTGQPAMEVVEPRAEAKENAGEREPAQHVPDTAPGKRDTGIGSRTEGHLAGGHLSEVGAGCEKAARPVLCGGRGVIRVPTAIDFRRTVLHTTRYRKPRNIHRASPRLDSRWL
jgi:hypothetical protein